MDYKNGGVQIDLDKLETVLTKTLGLTKMKLTRSSPAWPGYELRGIAKEDAGDKLIRIMEQHEEKWGEPYGYALLRPNVLLLMSEPRERNESDSDGTYRSEATRRAENSGRARTKQTNANRTGKVARR